MHARPGLWESEYQLFIFPHSVQICCKMTPKMEVVISMSNGHCPCWWQWEVIDKQNTTLNIFQIKNVEGADWRHRKNCGLRLRRTDLPKAFSLRMWFYIRFKHLMVWTEICWTTNWLDWNIILFCLITNYHQIPTHKCCLWIWCDFSKRKKLTPFKTKSN